MHVSLSFSAPHVSPYPAREHCAWLYLNPSSVRSKQMRACLKREGFVSRTSLGQFVFVQLVVATFESETLLVYCSKRKRAYRSLSHLSKISPFVVIHIIQQQQQ